MHDEIVILLPGLGNFGYIRINQISNEYTNYLNKELNNKSNIVQLSDMYSIGNLVRCKVLNYEKKRLYLTIDPNEVNRNLNSSNLEEDMIISGAVKTKEDHGYTIDLGISNITAFFPTKEENLIIGKTLNFKITSKQTENMVKLTLCTEREFNELKTKTKFDSYLPGTKITCSIDQVCSNGLKLAVYNLTGYIHVNHLIKSGGGKQFKNLSAKYKHGDKLDATIIFINPYSKLFYLTLLPHLTGDKTQAKLEKIDTQPLIGEIFDCKVVSHSLKGLYVEFHDTKQKQLLLGFIPKFDLIDDKQKAKNTKKADLIDKYPNGKQITARAIKINPLEDLVLLSAKKNVLSMNYLNYDSIEVGQLVNGKIKGFITKNCGLNVELSEYVNGFIPRVHNSDIPLNEPLLKMPVGKEVKCKVIKVDRNERKLILSTKKSLVKSKLPDIKAIDENIQMNQVTLGIVASIKEFGLIVSFLNDVKALLPLNDIAKFNNIDSKKLTIEELSNLYYIGQLLKVRITFFDTKEQKIRVSLNVEYDETAKQEKKLKKQEAKEKKVVEEKIDLSNAYKIGTLIDKSNCQIEKINQNKEYLKIKLKNENDYGYLYKYHLTDIPELNEKLFSSYKIDDYLTHSNEVMVIREKFYDQKDKLQYYYLTTKKTLIDNFVQQQNFLTGWACKFNQKGILIDIPANKKNGDLNMGFCSLKKLKVPLNQVELGTSLMLRDVKPLEGKNLNLCQIKMVGEIDQKSDDNEMLYKFECIFSLIHMNHISIIEKNIDTKSSIKVKIIQIDQNTNKLTCQISEEMYGYGYMPIEMNLDETKLTGSEIESLIIDYDYLSSMFCLIFDKKLIKPIKTHSSTNLACRIDQQIKAEVAFFTNNYICVMLKQHALGKLAYIPLFKSYATQSKLQEMQKKLEILEKNSKHKYNYFTIGTECKVNIKKIEDNVVFCLPEGKLKINDTVPSIDIPQEQKVIKRKIKNDDRVKVIIQNNEELTNEDHIGDKVDFPWELNSFDKFYELINPIESDSETKDEPQLKKKKKLNDDFKTDKEIFEIEEKLCDLNREPQTPDDYERLLVSNPNSSLVWIKYIVFYLQSADLDKARHLALRALKSINYRLEDEKLNVWVAYMNFENMYGNNESLHEVFQKAVQACDSLKVHQHLAEIYFRSNKINEARETYNIMTKKFKSEPEIWIKFAIFEYKTSNIDNARKLLVKCLTCLDKRHRKLHFLLIILKDLFKSFF